MLVSLCFVSTFSTMAAANVWKSTFGQQWFYETTSSSGDTLAGTWWEGSLEPGTTYNISFEVSQLSGAIGLFVGSQNMISIDRKGSYSYDFSITNGGERRLMFTAIRNNVTAGVGKISVTPKGGSQTEQTWDGGSGGGSWLPKGHYLSFSRERNLKKEMLEPMANPYKAQSGWHLDIARDMHDALTTPGVKGFYVEVDWRSLERGDGWYDWNTLDDNMEVARKLGLKFIVKVGTRSFDGTNRLPAYFPSKYSIWTQGGGKSGFTAKMWDPYVYNRLIRLYKRIGQRYGSDAGFGGIATSETALGNFSGHGYSLAAYRTALTQIVTQTQAALPSGKLFWYLNFVKGGDSSDMNKDQRINLLKNVPHKSLVVGGPDITPDVPGMPGSLSSYRIHAKKKWSGLDQFCHAQHVDQGMGGVNKKTNKHRKAYLDQVAEVRRRENQSWFSGQRAAFEFDDLRDPNGRKTDLHPNWVVGDLWNPWELFAFADRNFDCDYFFWHYRENVHNRYDQFWWEDIRPVILNNQYFYN